MPTLTAILCNYNHGEHVGKAITAIATQSRPPDEFIIIEDGSTDNSVAVIEPLARKYPFIQFLRNPSNKGLMYSFERALNLATGDFVYGASADDFVLPAFFEKSMKAAEEFPESGIICGRYRCEYSNGKYAATVGFDDWTENGFRSAEEFKRYLFIHPTASVSCSNLYNRREFINVGGYRPDFGPLSDYFAAHALALKFGGYYFPHNFAVNVIRGSGYSHSFYQDPERAYETIEKMAALMRSPEFSDRFSSQHVTQFEIYLKLLIGPFNPKENALVPMNLYHVREAFLALATWESPISMIAAFFMKFMLKMQKIFGSKP